YMIAAAATRGDVVVKNIIPKHLDAIIAKLREMGVEIIENGDSLRVKADKTLKNVNVKTLVYPGFPTDLQQPMSSLLSISKGVGVISETIFEGRFKHVDELKRMGANIKVDGRTAIVQGVEKLTGAKVNATDLRAGAALVIAGLAAEGRTEITNIHYIQRGYDDLCKKLANLGADIKEV
ncbi:MAG: UDP-N-acetylglucosamine 1-carboxyvinyltransferase, partial [Clostridiales bacterium]|nr:UDP-N-acetylglucosamine 1-carboxyvinyltransferase [Clostridiales bacterium]